MSQHPPLGGMTGEQVEVTDARMYTSFTRWTGRRGGACAGPPAACAAGPRTPDWHGARPFVRPETCLAFPIHDDERPGSAAGSSYHRDLPAGNGSLGSWPHYWISFGKTDRHRFSGHRTVQGERVPVFRPIAGRPALLLDANLTSLLPAGATFWHRRQADITARVLEHLREGQRRRLRTTSQPGGGADQCGRDRRGPDPEGNFNAPRNLMPAQP